MSFYFTTLSNNEEITTKIKYLSEGQKAKLSLAIISLKIPSLLILDEITNNLDLNTKNNIISILKNYPGAFILISHDEHFTQKININKIYEIK